MPHNELGSSGIGAAIEAHKLLRPGLLESAYEECLARKFTLRNISFQRQKPAAVVYQEVKLGCGYRLDFLVGGRVVGE